MIGAFYNAVNDISFPSFLYNEGKALQAVEDLGWTYHNCGGNLTYIYKSPNPRIVARINYTKDFAFQIYADLCQTLPHNPYLQNVYGHFTLKDGTHIAILERLVHVPFKQDKNPPGRARAANDFYRFLQEGYDHHDLSQKYLADPYVREAMQHLYATIDVHHGTESRLRSSFDCHADNVMGRVLENGTIQPVITDPYETGEWVEKHDYIDNLTPWSVYLRRKVGLMDPSYFNNLPNNNRNSWILK